MSQHPTDGTPIKDSAPVNNDNDGITVAPKETDSYPEHIGPPGRDNIHEDEINARRKEADDKFLDEREEKDELVPKMTEEEFRNAYPASVDEVFKEDPDQSKP